MTELNSTAKCNITKYQEYATMTLSRSPLSGYPASLATLPTYLLPRCTDGNSSTLITAYHVTDKSNTELFRDGVPGLWSLFTLMVHSKV